MSSFQHPQIMTAKELALLTFFLRHQGQVLSRTRIYDHVWDESFDGLSNTLEVHVMELRRKLEAHGPRVIHTVRGRGYLYEATPPTESPSTPSGSPSGRGLPMVTKPFSTAPSRWR